MTFDHKRGEMKGNWGARETVEQEEMYIVSNWMR